MPGRQEYRARCRVRRAAPYASMDAAAQFAQIPLDRSRPATGMTPRSLSFAPPSVPVGSSPYELSGRKASAIRRSNRGQAGARRNPQTRTEDSWEWASMVAHTVGLFVRPCVGQAGCIGKPARPHIFPGVGTRCGRLCRESGNPSRRAGTAAEEQKPGGPFEKPKLRRLRIPQNGRNQIVVVRARDGGHRD